MPKDTNQDPGSALVEDLQGAETPETPEVETPEPESTVETPVQRTFLDDVQELGFTDVKDEEEARQRLVGAFRQTTEQYDSLKEELSRLKPFVQYGQEYVELQRDPGFQQFRAGRQNAQAPPPKAEHEHWWSPPKVDMAMVSRYRDATKPDGWKENTPAEVRVSAEAYQAHVDKWAADLVERPHEALRSPIRHELVSAIRDEDPEVIEVLKGFVDSFYGSKVQEQTESQFWQTVEAENASWLYAIDPRTQKPAIDPRSGEAIPTPEGADVFRWIERGKSIGISTHQDLWEYAMAMHQKQTNTPLTTTTETREEKRNAHLRRGAVSRPSRSGGAAPSETPKPRSQNPNLSPGDLLLQQLQAG